MVLQRVVGFGILAVPALSMSAEEVGRLATYIALVELTTLAIDFGVSGSVSRSTAAMSSGSEFMRPARSGLSRLWKVTGWILVGLAGAAVIPTLRPWALLGLLATAIGGLLAASSVLEASHHGQLRFGRPAAVSAVSGIASLVALTAALPGLGEYAVFVALAVRGVVRIVGLTSRELIRARRLAQAPHDDMVGYAKHIGVALLAFFLYARVDVLVLSSFGLHAEIAAYELAMRLLAVGLLPFAILGRALGPRVAQSGLTKSVLLAQPRWKRTRRLAGAAGCVVAALFAAVFLFISERVVSLTDQGTVLLTVTALSVTLPIRAWGILLTTAVLTPSNGAKLVGRVTLGAGLANVLLDVVLIYSFGYAGVFLSTVIVHSTAVIVLDRLALRPTALPS